jgi:hypothetical protein
LQWVVSVNFVVLTGVGIAYRFWRLGSVPGLNADEYFCLESMRYLMAGDTKTLGFFVPTGRVLDFFYAVPTWLFDKALPGHAATIRLPAAFSGLVMAVACFPLLRAVRSTFFAGIVTVFATICPLHISYSRIGWDYSQIPLAALFMVAAAMSKRLWMSALALVFGFLVHPSLAYLVPMSFLAFVAALFHRLKPRGVKGYLLMVALPIMALGGIAVVLILSIRSLAESVLPMLSGIPALLTNSTGLYSYLELYANLFSPLIAQQNLIESNSIPFGMGHAAFLGLNAFLYGSYFVTWPSRRQTEPHADRDLGLAVGLIAGIFAFYLTRGTQSVTPPWERYGLFMMLPSIAVLAMMAETLAKTPGQKAMVLLGCCAAAWLVVVDFNRVYFDFFERTGGERTHYTYQSNTVDPKVAAAEWIAARTPEAVVFTKEWRSHWPVEYTLRRRASVAVRPTFNNFWTVMPGDDFGTFLSQKGSEFKAALNDRRAYVVGFADGNFETYLRSQFAEITWARQDFPTRNGTPMVSVWYAQ